MDCGRHFENYDTLSAELKRIFANIFQKILDYFDNVNVGQKNAFSLV